MLTFDMVLMCIYVTNKFVGCKAPGCRKHSSKITGLSITVFMICCMLLQREISEYMLYNTWLYLNADLIYTWFYYSLHDPHINFRRWCAFRYEIESRGLLKGERKYSNACLITQKVEDRVRNKANLWSLLVIWRFCPQQHVSKYMVRLLYFCLHYLTSYTHWTYWAF